MSIRILERDRFAHQRQQPECRIVRVSSKKLWNDAQRCHRPISKSLFQINRATDKMTDSTRFMQKNGQMKFRYSQAIMPTTSTYSTYQTWNASLIKKNHQNQSSRVLLRFVIKLRSSKGMEFADDNTAIRFISNTTLE